MKKLQKLSLKGLEKFECIQQREMQKMIGGTGGGEAATFPENWCFYNCICYLHKELYGDDSVEAKDVAADYYNGKGNTTDNWNGTNNLLDYAGGVEIYDKDNNPNQTSFNYLSNLYETEGSNWCTDGSEIRRMAANNEDDNLVLGVFGSSTRAHAVIFTGYENGQYTYYDPSSGLTGSISESEVMYAASVGAKDKDENE